MNTTNPNQPCYSADVRMQLLINGTIHTIGQLAPDFVILDDPCDHPPGQADIVVSIDGRERRWTVQLLHGVQTDQHKTAIARYVSVERSAAG